MIGTSLITIISKSEPLLNGSEKEKNSSVLRLKFEKPMQLKAQVQSGKHGNKEKTTT